ncbi:hypothetical protein D3C87_126080 [compost metagenome]
MQIKNIAPYFLIAAVVIGCVPTHIRQHQASQIENAGSLIQSSRNRCDGFLTNIGTTSYTIKHPTVKLGSIRLIPSETDDKLKLEISLVGTADSTIRFDGDNVKFKYANQDWNKSFGKLETLTVFRSLGKMPEPVLKAPALFRKDIAFEENDEKKTKILVFEASIPKSESDLEVEIPEVYLGTDLLTPKSLRFKWHDRWTTAPLNGC